MSEAVRGSYGNVTEAARRLGVPRSRGTARPRRRFSHGFRELGEYLVETFFAGALENFAAEKRHASWRALANRGDLQVSHSTLWYSVAILGQLRELGNTGESLPVSHHRRLLPIRDAAAKKALAKRAVDESLTVAQLEKEIAKQRRKESCGEKRGWPRIPDYLESEPRRALRDGAARGGVPRGGLKSAGYCRPVRDLRAGRSCRC